MSSSIDKSDNWKSEWKIIRERLNDKYDLNNETADDWKQAVKIFSARFKDFYINPIDKLVNPTKPKDKYKGQGFVIVTAQCALIETFAAFKNGKIYHSDKEEDEIYYRQSRKLFVDFLESEKLFKDNFGGDEKPKAGTFYSGVRCGLLHETRTKVEWVIKADVSNYLKKDIVIKETFIANINGKNIIFRNQLQKALNNYFKDYKKDLKNEDEGYKDLRRFFARKLDHLFDIKEKEGYEWWN